MTNQSNQSQVTFTKTIWVPLFFLLLFPALAQKGTNQETGKAQQALNRKAPLSSQNAGLNTVLIDGAA